MAKKKFKVRLRKGKKDAKPKEQPKAEDSGVEAASSEEERPETDSGGEGESTAIVPAAETPESTTLTVEGNVHLPVVVNVRSNIALETSRLNDAVPKFACSTCTISSECPEFREGYVCAFNDAFKSFDVRSVDNVIELMRIIVNRNKERMFRAFMHEEIVSGGQLDPNVTRQSEIVLGQLQRMVELSTKTKRIGVHVVGPGASQQGGGVLSRLFGADTPGELNLNEGAELKEEARDESKSAEKEVVDTTGEQSGVQPDEG